MARSNFRVLREIDGNRYRDLLSAAQRVCDSFMLVVRPDLRLSRGAQALIENLTPHLIEESKRSEWPGTRLMGQTARCLTFRFTGAAHDSIEAAVHDLYDWRQPELPEDLSFYAKGETWFFSMTHEREAYFRLEQEEYVELISRFPSLADVFR